MGLKMNRVLTIQSKRDPTVSISWDERCNGVSAYPICGHNVRSSQDTCKAVTLLQTSDRNQVLFCKSSDDQQDLSSLQMICGSDDMYDSQWCVSFHDQLIWT